MIPLRDARSGDVAAIAAILNQAIRETTAVWYDRERSHEEINAWMRDRTSAGYPVVIAERGGVIAGYGSFGTFRPHDGYAATVEHSLYVAPDARRSNIGRSLLKELETRARAASKHVMIGAIEADNEASLALHRSCGFEESARMPEVGRKFGLWLTLVLMQKTLI